MSDEFDADVWLASRPTLTEDRSHPNHWYNRAADLRASAGAIWYSMSAQNKEAVSEELGFGSGHSIGCPNRPNRPECSAVACVAPP